MNVALYDGIIKSLFVLVIISAATIITRRNILSLFTTYAAQSFLLALIAFVIYLKEGVYVLLFITILTIISKVILIPHIMKKIFKSMNIRRDVEFHHLSPTSSIFLSILIILLVRTAFSKPVRELSLNNLSFAGIVLGISLTFMGLLIMFSRSRAITKIVGYLCMENGVLLFSLFFAELPFMIEVLIIIDLVMIILLSTILAFGIDSTMKEFYEKLEVFKGWIGEK
jgi:hydrogenase-4 component E